MKIKIISGLLILSFALLSSCNWIDPGMNVNPATPTEASLATILPTTQAGTATVLGGTISRYSGFFTQQFRGTSAQWLNLYQYTMNETMIEPAWTTMMTGPMEDLHLLIDQAQTENSPYYKGIAEIMMAYCVGMWTDVLGDIPYSDAFQGVANKQPKYDSQQSIYTSLQNLLSQGITDCGAASSSKKPGSDDFIYSGNMAAWIKAAHTIKARLYLHVKDYNSALTELPLGISSSSGDMQFNFGNTASTSNPLFQFMGSSGSAFAIGPQILKILKSFKDPRTIPYADTSKPSNVVPGKYFASSNSPVFFITYFESKFIESECKLGTGDKAGAYQAYLSAINASLKKIGVADSNITTYMANPKVSVTQDSLNLPTIISQKYIAMFTQAESWTDWRRTGFPALTPTKSGSSIPKRFIYPQSERLFNNTNLVSETGYVNNPNWIFTKVWWDKTYWNP